MDRILYSSFARERREELQICTQILERDGKRIVRKSSISEKGKAHIANIHANESILNETYKVTSMFTVAPAVSAGEGWVELEYQEGWTAEHWIEEKIRREEISQVKSFLQVFWKELCRMKEEPFTASEDFVSVFGNYLPEKTQLHGAKNQNVDLILTNLFMHDEKPEKMTVTDYEWVYSFSVPLEYIFYRAIFCSMAISKLPAEEKEEIYEIAGIAKEDLNCFLQMEIAFQKTITGNVRTMAEYQLQFHRGAISVAADRSPYEIQICDDKETIDAWPSTEMNKQLDLSLYKSKDLRVQVGYPFSVITPETEYEKDWECENPDWTNGKSQMAGVAPLVYRWRGSGKKAFGYRIEDVDSFFFQDMVRSQIIHFQTIHNTLREQIVQTTAEKESLQEQIVQTTAEKESLQEQIVQITTEKESLQEQIVQTTTEKESLQGQIVQITTEKESLQDQLDAYRIEWQILNDEGKVKHKEPVALIRGKQARRQEAQKKGQMHPDATIVIPTKNGGDLFKQVLDRVFSQVTQYTYEVICVDSGSTDQTLQIIQETPAKLIQIPPEEFGHGKTRNLGASQGTGEFICFLTQDALPVHESWLENMLNAMKMDPEIAGGFGRHLPYPGCNFIDERDINGLFDGFGHSDTIYYNEDQTQYDNDPGYRSVLAFFSDNNSCLRRSVWAQFPYPDVEFAEDQIWMRQMIEKGYKKVYCPEASVYHSHNYDPSTYFMRYYDEHKGLYEIHGYMNLPRWYYVPAAAAKHVLGDWRYIRGTGNGTKQKLKMLVYSVRRNYARYTAGYIGGHYHLKDEETKKRLDQKYSQQYWQRRGVYGKRKSNKGENKMSRVGNAVRHLKQTYKDEGFVKSLKYIKNKTKSVYRDKGMQGVVEKITTISNQIDIPGFYGYIINDTKIPMDEKQRNEALKDKTILLNWIIPEMGIGSGGHMTIFRFISMLEDRGIHNKIYVSDPAKFLKDEDLRDFLKAHYNITNPKVEIYHSTDTISFAHGTVATGWQTAYFVRRFENTISKFYFVQDYEPTFYPMGSEYLMAENTYHFGFRGITAGEWLKDKMQKDYNMDAESFLFSYDRKVFKPGTKRDDKTRLFLYVRPVTPRRCFELALLALCRLYEKIPDIEVIMAGWDVGNYKIPFIHLNAGNITAPELADVYSQCDICIVMSSTNLSLMPIEVMACNSVCACTMGPNNDWMVNEENAIMIPNDPIGIADVLYEALKDPERLSKLREKGLAFAEHYTTWEKEADKVYQYVVKAVEEDTEAKGF